MVRYNSYAYFLCNELKLKEIQNIFHEGLRDRVLKHFVFLIIRIQQCRETLFLGDWRRINSNRTKGKWKWKQIIHILLDLERNWFSCFSFYCTRKEQIFHYVNVNQNVVSFHFIHSTSLVVNWMFLYNCCWNNITFEDNETLLYYAIYLWFIFFD